MQAYWEIATEIILDGLTGLEWFDHTDRETFFYSRLLQQITEMILYGSLMMEENNIGFVASLHIEIIWEDIFHATHPLLSH